jgi:hypothetical protein
VIESIGLLVALAIGFAIGRHRVHAIQNRGEARLSREVQNRFHSPDYHLLSHITLRLKDRTTQVDHILISRFGIFVIETKDYKGSIFAGAKDRNWTQVLYRAKFRFQNVNRRPTLTTYRRRTLTRDDGVLGSGFLFFLDLHLMALAAAQSAASAADGWGF